MQKQVSVGDELRAFGFENNDVLEIGRSWSRIALLSYTKNTSVPSVTNGSPKLDVT